MELATFFYISFAVIYLLIVCSTVIVIVLDNRQPVKTVAWVLVVSSLPVVGLVAVAAAALLFLGVWTQASRAENWAQEPSQVPFVLACPDFA